MKTFLTAISMQGTLTEGIYEPVGFTLDQNRTTAFPIIPIIAQERAENPEEDFTILAVVPKNSDTAQNYQKFLAELAALGIGKDAVRKIEIREDQSEIVGLAMFADILKQTPDDTDVYACVTYGTKAVSLLMAFSLIFMEKLKVNCLVQGMYYGEVRREANKELGRRLYNLVKYLQLGEIVDSISQMGLPDAEELFKKVIIGEDE